MLHRYNPRGYTRFEGDVKAENLFSGSTLFAIGSCRLVQRGLHRVESESQCSVVLQIYSLKVSNSIRFSPIYPKSLPGAPRSIRWLSLLIKNFTRALRAPKMPK